MIKVLLPSDFIYLLCGKSRLCHGYSLILGEAVVDTVGAGKGDDVAYLVEVEVCADGV